MALIWEDLPCIPATLQGRSIGTCIQWREAGVIEKLMTMLHGQVRSSGQKKNKWTTLIMIDFGCSAKYRSAEPWAEQRRSLTAEACNASVESKGFCFYKATNGREFWDRFSAPKSLMIKRHLAVDTLGFPFFTHCTSANVSDDAGLLFDVESITWSISDPNL